MKDSKTEYITIKQLAKMGYMTENAIRNLIWADSNFREKTVSKLKKKIFINLQAFYKYLDETKLSK